MAAFTNGLMPFIAMELEIQPTTLPPDQIAMRLYGLGEQLMKHGLYIKDGDTVGISETEKISATYARQGQRPGIRVIELRLNE